MSAQSVAGFAPPDRELDRQDVVWTSPSKDSSGSMPIGNGEVVLNTWVEAGTGDLLILIARTDSFSEISRILKVGRIRVKITPSPFVGDDFSQRLRLRQGLIDFQGQGESIHLFVDSDQDVVHLASSFKAPRRVEARVEIWRDKPYQLAAPNINSAWTAQGAPFPLVESADQVLDLKSVKRVGWIHHNETSVVPAVLELQSLTGLKGTHDPVLGRTFGAVMEGPGLEAVSPTRLASTKPLSQLNLGIAVHSNQKKESWMTEALKALLSSQPDSAAKRTQEWWGKFWKRSHVFIKESLPPLAIPDNSFPLRKGFDSGGGNRFPGEIGQWAYWDRALTETELSINPQQPGSMPEGQEFHPKAAFTLKAKIKPTKAAPGRIFDKVTAGVNDGFLFDTHPGKDLRLIVGDLQLIAPNVLKLDQWQTVAAVVDCAKGEARIYLDGKVVAQTEPLKGSPITRGYVLQRYVQACQGRGEYPIKFNGGYYTVEPTPMGIQSTPDFRNWGDCFWFQNIRHMTHPMMAAGDFDLTESFFRLYEKSRLLAEERSALYHGSKGAYFPETMTPFGTYSGRDYGWNREGLEPKVVQCPWWDDAWNQGPELVNLMLDRWDITRDEAFLKQRVLPMAESILRYFDTRFKKDHKGRIVIDPTQVVETYWEGVVNDTPCVAGLIRITDRLTALPLSLLTPGQRSFFVKMKDACPPLPIEEKNGLDQIAPAENYAPKISNVENGELYAVWPFAVVSLKDQTYLEEAKRAYANRKNRLDNGWGYDGNAAAILGMADEAARILSGKVRNSHPGYRWPATWGPNFDWLPDQNHGGNLLNQTQLMLIQSDPLELGGQIRLLPAWPKNWDASFKLHAAGRTLVECDYVGGKVVRLKVTPSSRMKDVLLPEGVKAP